MHDDAMIFEVYTQRNKKIVRISRNDLIYKYCNVWEQFLWLHIQGEFHYFYGDLGNHKRYALG